MDWPSVPREARSFWFARLLFLRLVEGIAYDHQFLRDLSLVDPFRNRCVATVYSQAKVLEALVARHTHLWPLIWSLPVCGTGSDVRGVGRLGLSSGAARGDGPSGAASGEEGSGWASGEGASGTARGDCGRGVAKGDGGSGVARGEWGRGVAKGGGGDGR